MRIRRALAWVVVLSAAAVLPEQGEGAERGPVRIGLPVPLTGGAAQIGADMRNGFLMAVEEAGAEVAGRRLEVLTEDDGGVPAQTLTKVRKLVEADQVHVVAGVHLAPSCWAVAPYLNTKKIPYFFLCGNDDLTQRKPQEYLVRFSWNGTQPSHPFGEFVAKNLGYRRIATLGTDYNFGWEVIGGFHRTFEENGGTVVQKLWFPLNTQDFAPYLSQIKRQVDAVYVFAFGALALRVTKQYQDFGLKNKIPLIGGGPMTDESVLPQMGDEARGIITALHYSAALDTPANKRFVRAYRAKYQKVPSQFSSDTYVIGQAIVEAIKAVNGDVETTSRFLAAARNVKLPETPRGQVELDDTGNVINNVYVRKVERVGGELQNTVIYTYPRVSQFWKYNKEEYLREPLYDRDNPPCRFCE